MKKSEAYTGMVNRLAPLFIEKGFKLHKTKLAAFYKTTDHGYQLFSIRVLDYRPLQKIEFGCVLSHTAVHAIIDHINARFNLVNVASNYEDNLAWGYPHSLGRGVPNKCQVREEEDFEQCFPLVKKYVENYCFPFFDRFSDIRNIDQEINGKDFWETDWLKPYGLVGLFFFKRSIIAHLCANPRLDEIRKYHVDFLEKAVIDDPEFYKRHLEAYLYLFEYLKNVPPLK